MTLSNRAQDTPTSHATWPRAGASAVILRDGQVLLVERGKGAAKGLWSFPGGHIEPGERAAMAAEREVREETGIASKIAGLLDVQDVLIRDKAGLLTAHYVLAVFWGHLIGGTLAAASDAADARFVPIEHLDGYILTQGARRLVTGAVNRLREQR
jgi:8-oxo-dGTP diphosphatase